MLCLIVISYFFLDKKTKFNFDTNFSHLSFFHANLKASRAASFVYHNIKFNSIPVLLQKYVPMSLLKLDTLHQFLEQLAHLQTYAPIRLALAIPSDNVPSHHEAQLLQEVLTYPQGFLLKLYKPLASRTSVMANYETIPLPMLQPVNASACDWEPEAQYLSVSQSRRITALVTEAHLANCIGSVQ